MDWTTAWQLAGEVVDIIGIAKVSASEQEKIAFHIQSRAGKVFNSTSQKWQDDPLVANLRSEIQSLQNEIEEINENQS